MANTLAETILEISRQHLRDGGLIMGQNLEAQQNVIDTVPVGEPGVVILPTSEAAMAGVAIGAALSGKPIIYILRFSSFSWLQASPLVNYAAKAKEIWSYDCPLFVRVLAMDGGGPVHTGAMHSLFCYMPGLAVAAPITPLEYQDVWSWFQHHRQPIIVSEHRSTYQNSEWLPWMFEESIGLGQQRYLIVAIGNARLSARTALQKLNQANIGGKLAHVFWLEPFCEDSWDWIVLTSKAVEGVVVTDCAYEPCSVAEHIGYRIASESGAKVRIVGMEPRLSGVAARLENGTPSVERIMRAVKELLG